MEQESDPRLVELAQAGDQLAFAELYNRYFEPVYDFVARMTRNRDEAADIAQDAFLKGMNSLGGLHKGASFKGWIFTIARNTALNRIERAKRTRPLVFEDAEGEEVSFDVVDPGRFADPAEAAEANAMAALVWEAAAGLDPKQLSLLDLHLRQGLDSAEIADVMGVTKNNGYVMLNRLKKAVEDSIGAFIMFKDGRRYCDDLSAVIGDARAAGPISPALRKSIENHVAQCDVCEERKRKLVAPLAVFGAFAMVGSPEGTKAAILDHLMRQWPGPAAGAPPPNSPGGIGGGLAGDGPGKFVKVFAALGMAAAVLFLLLVLPISPIALTRSDGDDVAAADATTTTAAASPSPTSAQAVGGQPTATNTPGGASSSPTGTTSVPTVAPSTTKQPQEGGGPTDPPLQTSTPTATQGPGTPTPIPPTPTKPPTATPTPSPTATPTPSPTATQQPCTSTLTPNTSAVNAQAGATSFDILNNFCASVQYTLGTDSTGWFTLGRNGGTIEAGGHQTVNISANPSLAGEGSHLGVIHVYWPDGSFDVTVSVNNPGSPPLITGSQAVCKGREGSFALTVNVSDDFAVTTVKLTYTTADGAQAMAAMSLSGAAANGTWQYTGPGALLSYTIVAVDAAGHIASTSGGC
jgi:RNA polymerase sigma factor (sigma-70 family)